MNTFKKAERKKAKARIALCAPAGGGKTHSALLIAKGLGGKIAVIDTENNSAQMEAGKAGIPEYDVMTIEAPYDPKKYIDAIKAAEEEGYDAIIIDSLSHAWSGSGGLLDKQGKLSEVKGNNSYTAWRFVTPLHNQLVDAILQSKCHVIATMRTKVEYAIEKDDKGKTRISKVGLAPIQREGMDYEFTIVFDLTQDRHIATCSKDRTSLFDNQVFIPSEETGKAIIEWLNSGADEHPTNEQTEVFKRQLKEMKMTKAKWETATKSRWDKLSEKDADLWIKRHEFKIKKSKDNEILDEVEKLEKKGEIK